MKPRATRLHAAATERDNEACLFVRAAGVHRIITRYQVKNNVKD